MGGALRQRKKWKFLPISQKQKLLPSIQSFTNPAWTSIQMTMWGEVAELMEDLATAHCYCEYTKLESLETVTWADRNDADIACANEGIISKKEAFIWWALPLHRQRLGDEQQ